MTKGKELTQTSKQEVVAASRAFVQNIIHETKAKFMEVNEGMDLDFVFLGEWLKKTKLGEFCLSADETQVFGKVLDVVICSGEKRYIMWGKDSSPEEGQLIIAANNELDAKREFSAFIEVVEGASERYSAEDLKLTYLAYVITTDQIGDESPALYILPFPQTDTMEYAGYSKRLFTGSYKNIGIPKYTGVNQVITRISTVEKKSRNNKSYVGFEFEAVALFDPKEFIK